LEVSILPSDFGIDRYLLIFLEITLIAQISLNISKTWRNWAASLNLKNWKSWHTSSIAHIQALGHSIMPRIVPINQASGLNSFLLVLHGSHFQSALLLAARPLRNQRKAREEFPQSQKHRGFTMNSKAIKPLLIPLHFFVMVSFLVKWHMPQQRVIQGACMQ
jgi:hypothetical protein